MVGKVGFQRVGLIHCHAGDKGREGLVKIQKFASADRMSCNQGRNIMAKPAGSVIQPVGSRLIVFIDGIGIPKIAKIMNGIQTLQIA